MDSRWRGNDGGGGLTPRPPLHMVERGWRAWNRPSEWSWIAAFAAMTGGQRE